MSRLDVDVEFVGPKSLDVELIEVCNTKDCFPVLDTHMEIHSSLFVRVMG